MKRTGVMQPEILNIEYGKGEWLKDIHHLTQCGHVGTRKNPPFNPLAGRLLSVASHGMDQPPATLLQGTVNHTAQGLIVFSTHMFKHAHRDKNIILACDITVVILNIFHTIIQALGPGTLLRISDLFMGDVIGADLYTIMTHHMTC